VVTDQLGQERPKIMQVNFAKNGSLFVSMPYYVNHEGLAAVVTVPPRSRSKAGGLQDQGRVTSHLVK